MKTSPAGRAAITAREGRRLTAYQDPRGILTIGVGHTGRMAPPKVEPGMTIDEAQCDAFLAADLAPVERVINANVSVPLSQNEFDALASLAFNTGVGALARSKTIVSRLNRGDVAGAADAFLLWDKPASLIERRTQEKAQFLTPDAPNAAGVSRSATVASQRAQHLSVRASAASARARTTRNGGVATAAGGAVIAVGAAHAGWGAAALWLIAIVVVGIVIDAAVAVSRMRASTMLAANAQKQSTCADTLTAARTHASGLQAKKA